MGILIDTLINVKTHRDKGMYVQTKDYTQRHIETSRDKWRHMIQSEVVKRICGYGL